MLAVAGPPSPPVIGGNWTRDPPNGGRHQGALDRGGDAPDGLKVHALRVPKAPKRSESPPARTACGPTAGAATDLCVLGVLVRRTLMPAALGFTRQRRGSRQVTAGHIWPWARCCARRRAEPSRLHGEVGIRLRPPTVSRLSATIQHVVLRRTTAPRASTALSRAAAVSSKAAEGLVKSCGWHARGQGFKSPQLHPRSEGLSAGDRPRSRALAQLDSQQPRARRSLRWLQ